jgi:hypothetical protein
MKIAYCENFKVLNAESDTYFVGGWILSKSINNHTNNFELIDKNELEDSWRMEKDKRKRLSSAITAMLVRSHSIPKATRFSRSLFQHATNSYPGKPLLQISKKSIEDIMIGLGGLTGLKREEVFEYIKVASVSQVMCIHLPISLPPPKHTIISPTPSSLC